MSSGALRSGAGAKPPRIDREAVRRLWLRRQGLAAPRGEEILRKETLTRHLEATGGLQLDSINVLERAHYLTLWSRFGVYDRRELDRWIYRHHLAYEYWAHEASILPISHLPLSRRRMRAFPPESWRAKAWWSRFQTSTASRRRVLRRLREEGPLESSDFESDPEELGREGAPGGTLPLAKEDRRSLKLLWHGGRVAVAGRRHFRCLFDLAERIYPEGGAARAAELEDSWLLQGLAGNGIATEVHLNGYLTSVDLKAGDRRRIVERNLRKGRITEVRVDGLRGRCYALPEHLEGLDRLPEPRGTTLLSPFDSLLWQRRRAADLLGFHYRLEVYTPEAKREFGYYAMPILHRGRLVGRLDPKLHRERGELEIKALQLEPGFQRDGSFDDGLRESLESLATFVGAKELRLPEGW